MNGRGGGVENNRGGLEMARYNNNRGGCLEKWKIVVFLVKHVSLQPRSQGVLTSYADHEAE